MNKENMIARKAEFREHLTLKYNKFSTNLYINWTRSYFSHFY